MVDSKRTRTNVCSTAVCGCYEERFKSITILDEKKKKRKFASPILDKKKKKRKFASPAA